jgi:hypothetical protein
MKDFEEPMLRKRLAIVMVMAVGILVCGCGLGSEAPHTEKYLRSLNSSTAFYYADIANEFGVEYVDSDGVSIMSLALDPETEVDFLEAVIKDKADLYHTYPDDVSGDQLWPLEHVYSAGLFGLINVITDVGYEKFKLLLKAGTALDEDDILLFEVWRGVNTYNDFQVDAAKTVVDVYKKNGWINKLVRPSYEEQVKKYLLGIFTLFDHGYSETVLDRVIEVGSLYAKAGVKLSANAIDAAVEKAREDIRINGERWSDYTLDHRLLAILDDMAVPIESGK